MAISDLDLTQIKQKINRYCLKITQNQWEAEDLSQEVLIKIFHAVEAVPPRTVTNAYLYRIANNAWKDKMKMDRHRVQTTDAALIDTAVHDGELSTRELLEALADRISPRAMVILLLMDVFDFTAKETAEFLSSTEGTIQVTLGRVRTKLKKLALLAEMDMKPGAHDRNSHAGLLDLDSLVEAFKRRDPEAICKSYLGLVRQRVRISKLSWIEGKLAFYIEDSDGNRFLVTE
ncbi:RNA polymerase sigma factor [Paenibacillus sepulcri]|uniref:RNA polymerase sigma factor n=1 Tax=Paenibacillus sepulcri TaxID=359917 RepID=A0ABS7BX52_9BACL|nr:RNA polymerase sigma factor [Paenibacillus sepulcri]